MFGSEFEGFKAVTVSYSHRFGKTLIRVDKN
jgi:hypothetical protein